MRLPVLESLSRFALGLGALLVLVWSLGLGPSEWISSVLNYGGAALRTVGATVMYALPLVVLLGVPAGLRPGSRVDRLLQLPVLALICVPALLLMAVPLARELTAVAVVAPWLARAVRNGLAGAGTADAWGKSRGVVGRVLREFGNLVVVTLPLQVVFAEPHSVSATERAIFGASQAFGLAVPVLVVHLLGNLALAGLPRHEAAGRQPSRLWTEAGALLLLVLLGTALAAFGRPEQIDLASRLAPAGSGGHLLGTDDLGRDLLQRLAAGTRLSLAVAGGATAVAAAGGALLFGLGTVVGSRGASLLAPPVQAPSLFWISVGGLCLLFVHPVSALWFVLAIGLVSAPAVAFSLRRLREGSAVKAATGVWGALALVMAQSLFGEYWLSYSGVGLAPPSITLGGLVAGLAPLYDSGPNLMIPGVVLTLGIGGLMLIGQALMEASGDS